MDLVRISTLHAAAEFPRKQGSVSTFVIKYISVTDNSTVKLNLGMF